MRNAVLPSPEISDRLGGMADRQFRRILVAVPLHAKAGRERLSGILRYAGKQPGWSVTIVSTDEYLRIPPRDRIRYLTEIAPDGVICATMEVRKAILQALVRRQSLFARIPVVFMDAADVPQDSWAHVHMDNREIGRTAARYYLQRGYRSLAYIGTTVPGESSYDHARKDSFIAAAAEGGVRTPFFALGNDMADTTGQAALAEFLKAIPLPCGVFTYADWISRPVLDAASRAGLRVPDQIAILGVDDESEVCENTTPTLSSIAPAFERAGFQAAELLDLQIRNGTRQQEDVVYGIHHFAQRESTTDLRGGGRLVSAATTYIERHFREHVSVSGLAARLKVSRRLLEIRYREINGMTVQEAILARRLSYVRQLLQTTDLPLGEVALQSGFARYATLAVLFKRRFGQSLGDARRNRGAHGGR